MSTCIIDIHVLSSQSSQSERKKKKANMFKKSGAKTSWSSADRHMLGAGRELKTDSRKGRETVLSVRSQPFLFSKLLVSAGVSLCVLEPENTLW